MQNAEIMLKELAFVWFIIDEVQFFGIQLYHDLVSLLKWWFIYVKYLPVFVNTKKHFRRKYWSP